MISISQLVRDEYVRLLQLPLTEEEIKKLIAAAQARYDAMTPEQKAEHDRRQRESWARHNVSTGDPRFD